MGSIMDIKFRFGAAEELAMTTTEEDVASTSSVGGQVIAVFEGSSTYPTHKGFSRMSVHVQLEFMTIHEGLRA